MKIDWTQILIGKSISSGINVLLVVFIWLKIYPVFAFMKKLENQISDRHMKPFINDKRRFFVENREKYFFSNSYIQKVWPISKTYGKTIVIDGTTKRASVRQCVWPKNLHTVVNTQPVLNLDLEVCLLWKNSNYKKWTICYQ